MLLGRTGQIEANLRPSHESGRSIVPGCVIGDQGGRKTAAAKGGALKGARPQAGSYVEQPPSPSREPGFMERPDGRLLSRLREEAGARRRGKSKLKRINEPSHIVLFLLLLKKNLWVKTKKSEDSVWGRNH